VLEVDSQSPARICDGRAIGHPALCLGQFGNRLPSGRGGPVAGVPGVDTDLAAAAGLVGMRAPVDHGDKGATAEGEPELPDVLAMAAEKCCATATPRDGTSPDSD
jgi:hypothetical protein